MQCITWTAGVDYLSQEHPPPKLPDYSVDHTVSYFLIPTHDLPFDPNWITAAEGWVTLTDPEETALTKFLSSSSGCAFVRLNVE